MKVNRTSYKHAKGKMSEEIWDILWKGWQDQRNAIQMTLRSIDESCDAHIASLEDALSLIEKAGILFEKLDEPGQRRLLQHMVERVVINPEGQILRIELQSPFSYLHSLIEDGKAGASTKVRRAHDGKDKTSGVAGSFFVSIGAPGGHTRQDSHHQPSQLRRDYYFLRW